MQPPQAHEVNYICIGAGLLGNMLAEQKTLQDSNRRLALAMATAGHDLRQRLHSLLRTMELLTSSSDADRVGDLSRRAKSLILLLAADLEVLALGAEPECATRAHTTGTFAISPLMERIREDWEIEAMDKHLLFSVDFAKYVVKSDEKLLAAIMNNVIGNAVRHTNEGSVRVELRPEGQFLILAVTDTGPGISADELRRSFSFSSRSDASKGGLGLGLSIARSTAEILGHELRIATAAHSGTCVRLEVPLVNMGESDSCL